VEPARGEAHFTLPLRLSAAGSPVAGNDDVFSPPVRPEIEAILGSGLPLAAQATMIEYATHRQQQLGQQLVDEVQQLIGTLRAAYKRQEEASGDRDG
jgi:hypothetical protein